MQSSIHCTDTPYRSPGSERAGWRAFRCRPKANIQMRPIAFRPVRLAAIPFAVDAIRPRQVWVPVRAKRPCRASPAPGPGNHQGALARSSKPERTQRAIQRAKDPRMGVHLDSDRAIENRVERAGRRIDKSRGIPASLAMHIASARKPLGAERAPHEPLRGIRAQRGRFSPISARVPVRSRPLFAELFCALLPTAKAEVCGNGAGRGGERAR